MPSPRKQPIEFRQAEVGYVMHRWMSASSVSLVGIGSVGKSNLLQHLADSDVQAHYLENFNPAQFKTILIDPNMLGPLPAEGPNRDQVCCWAGYELMMHRLFMAFHPFDLLGPEDARRFYETYQSLQDGTNPLYAYMGLRYFEVGLDFFLRRGVQIVFMFDEFEELLATMPVKFFQTLRGLRDAYKQQLSYLTFSRAPLPVLVERNNIPALAIEPFIELFNDSVYYVGPYNETDARNMLRDLMRRNKRQYSDTVATMLLYITGGYAGLLRACFYALENYDPNVLTLDQYEQLMQQLALRVPIRLECRTIWKSLTPAEQKVLKSVARLTNYTVTAESQLAVAMLMQKRLIEYLRDSNHLEIHPPIFRAFVAANPDAD